MGRLPRWRRGEGKASSSFLKKRTKKILLLGGGTPVGLEPPVLETDKIFLVLFFKKEHSCLLSIGLRLSHHALRPGYPLLRRGRSRRLPSYRPA
jgi:hypothetical protein